MSLRGRLRRILACGAFALLACRAPVPAQEGARPAARPTVTLETASGRRVTVAVELARTPAEQERGLMRRERLGPDEGMLFLFDAEREHVFWMKDTFISLDLIFIDGRGEVVGVVERAEPLTTRPRTIGRASRSVLEVQGGWAATHGIGPGARATFGGIPASAPRGTSDP